MTLILAITNVEKLENGVSTRLRLDRHGALIGRSPQADWSLPDPQHYISSTHCEIDYRDGAYVLTDKSTNGAFLNGAAERMAGPHALRDGDQFLIGPYNIAAHLDGADAAAQPAAAGAAAPAWGGWDSHGAPPVSGDIARGWDRPAPSAAISGAGAMSGNWAPPRVETPPPSPPVSSVWNQPAAAVTPASDWSSPVSAPAAQPSAADVWGKLAEGNLVDWARGGFGSPTTAPVSLTPAPAKDPFGLGGGDAILADRPAPLAAPASPSWGPAAPASEPPPASSWGPATTAPVAVAASVPAPVAVPAPPPAPATAPLAPISPGGEWAAFLEAAGLQAADVKADPRAALAAAGDLLRRLTAGMVVMLEARARAKAQLGAQGTSLEFEGNNPLKFARSPEKALAQMINPPERGFMPAARAVEDSFRDLQAHQMATLVAMQGALAATLARFSPQAIRDRADMRGLLAKILPSARDAELWNAYQREFEGVARGSDEAFMDVFAKEFREAYEKAAADMKAKG